jgi:hypothetical protein
MDLGDAIAHAFIACAIAAIAFGVAVTLFCVFGIPWLWHLLKPALHTLTA